MSFPTPIPSEENHVLQQAALAVVLKHDRASISLVQRHLRIGYNRAAQLLEALENAGHVTPMNAEGRREVIRRSGPA